MRKIRMMCMKDRAIARTPPRKAKDIIVGLELEKEFPGYSDCLRSSLEERERTRRSRTGLPHKGRPPKFRLKVNGAETPQARKSEDKEERQRQATVLPRRRGRPP